MDGDGELASVQWTTVTSSCLVLEKVRVSCEDSFWSIVWWAPSLELVGGGLHTVQSDRLVQVKEKTVEIPLLQNRRENRCDPDDPRQVDL